MGREKTSIRELCFQVVRFKEKTIRGNQSQSKHHHRQKFTSFSLLPRALYSAKTFLSQFFSSSTVQVNLEFIRTDMPKMKPSHECVKMYLQIIEYLCVPTKYVDFGQVA